MNKSLDIAVRRERLHQALHAHDTVVSMCKEFLIHEVGWKILRINYNTWKYLGIPDLVFCSKSEACKGITVEVKTLSWYNNNSELCRGIGQCMMSFVSWFEPYLVVPYIPSQEDLLRTIAEEIKVIGLIVYTSDNKFYIYHKPKPRIIVRSK